MTPRARRLSVALMILVGLAVVVGRVVSHSRIGLAEPVEWRLIDPDSCRTHADGIVVSGAFEVRYWVPAEFLTLEASIRHSDGSEEMPYRCFSSVRNVEDVAERYEDPDVGRHTFGIEFCRRGESTQDTVAAALHVRLTSRFSGVVAETTIAIPPFRERMFTNPRYRVIEMRDRSIDPDRDGHPNGLEVTGRVFSDCQESVQLELYGLQDRIEKTVVLQPPSTQFRMKVDGRLLQRVNAGRRLWVAMRSPLSSGGGPVWETDPYRWSDFEALDPDSAR